MLKKELKILLAQDETREVIERLILEAEKVGDNQTHQELILLSANFEKVDKSQILGTSSESEIRIASAQINQGLLKIIDRIPLKPSSEKQLPTTPKSSNTWKFLIPAIAMVALVLMMKFLPSSGSDTSELTIFVHGSGGKQDYVLENQGELIVDFETARFDAKIGENGRTVFTEIPPKFNNQTLPITVKAEGFEPANPDAEYKLDGNPIYFEVQKDTKSRQIKGIVKKMDGSTGIPNVQIMIDNEFDIITDDLGRFEYLVEENKVKEKYDLSFQKEGYLPLREFYYPGSTAEFRLKLK